MSFFGDKKFDAIVIGSGLGGLSCALHLAHQGLKVLTLEKQPKVGGYAQNFQRGAYNFDVSLHIIPSLSPGQALYAILDEMQVIPRLKIKRHGPMYCSTFPDREYQMPGTFEEMAPFLKEAFPREKNGIDHLLDIFRQIVDTNFDLAWGNPVDVTTYFPNRYFHKNYTQLLAECTSDQKLQGLLGQFWQSTGLPNNRCAANWSAEVMGCHLLCGNYYIEGGGGALTQAMANLLEEAGCPVLTSARVDHILLENRQAIGVELQDGRQFAAPIIVSNAGPLQTYSRLLPAGTLSAPFMEKIFHLEPSCSLMTLYLGLDKPAGELGFNHHSQFINHTYDNQLAYDLAMNEQYDRSDFIISDYTNAGGHNHPAGQGIMEMLEAVPGKPWTTISRQDYLAKKARVKATMLQKLTALYPDLAGHITVSELATPRTLALATRHPDGAVYGFAQTPEQADVFRFGNTSVIKGLFFAGAWGRGGGGGYMGSIINGRVAAREILARTPGEHHYQPLTTYQPLPEESLPITTENPECTYVLTADDLAADHSLAAELFLKLLRRLQNELSAGPGGEMVQLTIMTVPGHKFTIGDQLNAQLQNRKNSDGKEMLTLLITSAAGQKLGHLNAIFRQ